MASTALMLADSETDIAVAGDRRESSQGE